MQLIASLDVIMAEAVQVLDYVVAEVVGLDKGVNIVSFVNASIYYQSIPNTIFTSENLRAFPGISCRRYF